MYMYVYTYMYVYVYTAYVYVCICTVWHAEPFQASNIYLLSCKVMTGM